MERKVYMVLVLRCLSVHKKCRIPCDHSFFCISYNEITIKKEDFKMTELVFILDRSGSMSGLEKDTIGGFNSMLEKQCAG